MAVRPARSVAAPASGCLRSVQLAAHALRRQVCQQQQLGGVQVVVSCGGGRGGWAVQLGQEL